MASVLTHSIIANANAAVDNYIAAANALYAQLEGIINPLTTTNFQGDASNGYVAFFTNAVKPALTESLTYQQSSLTASIKNMLESIEEQLLNQVDPQLGESNRSQASGTPAEAE